LGASPKRSGSVSPWGNGRKCFQARRYEYAHPARGNLPHPRDGALFASSGGEVLMLGNSIMPNRSQYLFLCLTSLTTCSNWASFVECGGSSQGSRKLIELLEDQMGPRWILHLGHVPVGTLAAGGT
jgi:hypothetical protein